MPDFPSRFLRVRAAIGACVLLHVGRSALAAAAAGVVPQQQAQLEESDLFSRQNAMLGRAATESLQRTHIAIIGTNGLAFETAKNAMLQGCATLTLVEPEPTAPMQAHDFGLNQFLPPESSAAVMSRGAATSPRSMPSLSGSRQSSLTSRCFGLMCNQLPAALSFLQSSRAGSAPRGEISGEETVVEHVSARSSVDPGVSGSRYQVFCDGIVAARLQELNPRCRVSIVAHAASAVETEFLPSWLDGPGSSKVVIATHPGLDLPQLQRWNEVVVAAAKSQMPDADGDVDMLSKPPNEEEEQHPGLDRDANRDEASMAGKNFRFLYARSQGLFASIFQDPGKAYSMEARDKLDATFQIEKVQGGRIHYLPPEPEELVGGSMESHDLQQVAAAERNGPNAPWIEFEDVESTNTDGAESLKTKRFYVAKVDKDNRFVTFHEPLPPTLVGGTFRQKWPRVVYTQAKRISEAAEAPDSLDDLTDLSDAADEVSIHSSLMATLTASAGVAVGEAGTATDPVLISSNSTREDRLELLRRHAMNNAARLNNYSASEVEKVCFDILREAARQSTLRPVLRREMFESQTSDLGGAADACGFRVEPVEAFSNLNSPTSQDRKDDADATPPAGGSSQENPGTVSVTIADPSPSAQSDLQKWPLSLILATYFAQEEVEFLPVSAVLAGVVAQEIAKIAGQRQAGVPLEGFMHAQFLTVLTEENVLRTLRQLFGCRPPSPARADATFAPRSRSSKRSHTDTELYLGGMTSGPQTCDAWKDQRSGDVLYLFGDALLDRLQRTRFLLPGVGAVGNEYVKTLATMGFPRKDKGGKLVLLDPDVIEVSNLSRQLLFRAHHWNQPKAVVAGNALAEHWPEIGYEAVQAYVCPETTARLLPKWKSTDVVLSALDTWDGRYYIEDMCMRCQIPFVNCGTSTRISGETGVIYPFVSTFRDRKDGLTETGAGDDTSQAFAVQVTFLPTDQPLNELDDEGKPVILLSGKTLMYQLYHTNCWKWHDWTSDSQFPQYLHEVLSVSGSTVRTYFSDGGPHTPAVMAEKLGALEDVFATVDSAGVGHETPEFASLRRNAKRFERTPGSSYEGKVAVLNFWKSSASKGAPDPNVRACQLRQFPRTAADCVHWAREVFERSFNEFPVTMKDLRRQLKAATQARDLDFARRREELFRIEAIVALWTALETSPLISDAELDGFVGRVSAELSVQLFWLHFHDAVRDLQRRYPRDKVEDDGTPFFHEKRKFPSFQEGLQLHEDSTHAAYVRSNAAIHKQLLARLAASMLRERTKWAASSKAKSSVTTTGGTTKGPQRVAATELDPSLEAVVDDHGRPLQYVGGTAGLTVKPWSPQAMQQEPMESGAADDAALLRIRELVRGLTAMLGEEDTAAEPPSSDEVAKFEYDKDQWSHLDFVYSAANLRARNHQIPRMQKAAVSRIAGRIGAASIAVTAAATGVAMIQVFKTVQKQLQEAYDRSEDGSMQARKRRKCGANKVHCFDEAVDLKTLANPSSSDMGHFYQSRASIEATADEWGVWETARVPATTLGGVLQWAREYLAIRIFKWQVRLGYFVKKGDILQGQVDEKIPQYLTLYDGTREFCREILLTHSPSTGGNALLAELIGHALETVVRPDSPKQGGTSPGQQRSLERKTSRGLTSLKAVAVDFMRGAESVRNRWFTEGTSRLETGAPAGGDTVEGAIDVCAPMLKTTLNLYRQIERSLSQKVGPKKDVPGAPAPPGMTASDGQRAPVASFSREDVRAELLQQIGAFPEYNDPAWEQANIDAVAQSGWSDPAASAGPPKGGGGFLAGPSGGSGDRAAVKLEDIVRTQVGRLRKEWTRRGFSLKTTLRDIVQHARHETTQMLLESKIKVEAGGMTMKSLASPDEESTAEPAWWTSARELRRYAMQYERFGDRDLPSLELWYGSEPRPSA
ncbi:unnamed protein product [Amoebophrya sp. A120]|nr:unnamed protein product [Amoebophrya sp. A120]|eukprot:GSA120T00003482001.1